jgi:hypothetical protein
MRILVVVLELARHWNYFAVDETAYHFDHLVIQVLLHHVTFLSSGSANLQTARMEFLPGAQLPPVAADSSNQLGRATISPDKKTFGARARQSRDSGAASH